MSLFFGWVFNAPNPLALPCNTSVAVLKFKIFAMPTCTGHGPIHQSFSCFSRQKKQNAPNTELPAMQSTIEPQSKSTSPLIISVKRKLDPRKSHKILQTVPPSKCFHFFMPRFFVAILWVHPAFHHSIDTTIGAGHVRTHDVGSSLLLGKQLGHVDTFHRKEKR